MHRADVNAKAKDGVTPLHDAAAHGQLQCMEVLVQHGADLSAVNEVCVVCASLILSVSEAIQLHRLPAHAPPTDAARS